MRICGHGGHAGRPWDTPSADACVDIVVADPCHLCGLSTDKGEHGIYELDVDPVTYIGTLVVCRGEVLCDNPRPLGVIADHG